MMELITFNDYAALFLFFIFCGGYIPFIILWWGFIYKEKKE